MTRFEDFAGTDDLIVVAGAGGFIGGYVMAALRSQGFRRLRGVDIKPLDLWFQRVADVEERQADLRQPDAALAAVAGAKVLLNFAADMGGMGYIEAHKANCMLSVLINTHLLIAARREGVARYFFASSACVYPDYRQHDANVTALKESDTYPAMPEDGYGWEKLFSERMCRHFHEDFGLVCRIGRYHNVYGPLGTFDGGREKAPAAICRKVIAAKLANRPEIEIWGDGEQTRSFTYIDDCLEGTMRLVSSACAAPLNIGSDEMVTINQLVDLVEEIANVRLTRRYNLDAPKGVRGRNSDNMLISQTLGWQPSIRLRDGIEQTYRWIYDELKGGAPDPRFVVERYDGWAA